MPLGGHTWYQTAVSDYTGLAGELWMSVHFNEHTMAAFLFKCMEEPPPAQPLYTESRILVRPEKKCLKFQQHQLASYNSYKILAIYLYSGSGVHALRHQVVTAY